MSTNTVSYIAGSQQQYPTMVPPQTATCQCPECLALMGYNYQPQGSYPAPTQAAYPYPAQPRQYPGSYTHSPYALAQQPPVQQAPATLQQQFQTPNSIEPNVTRVSRRRSSHSASSNEMSDTSSHTSGNRDSLDMEMEAGEASANATTNVSVAAIQKAAGRIVSISCTAHGSSFLQSALRQYPTEAFDVAIKEIQPVMTKLFSDKNACYVAKLLLEMMTFEDALQQLHPIVTNEELMILLCTKDLHSRRMVQFIMDFAGPDFCRPLFDLAMRRPMDIVRTQQGCITMQRILDHFTREERETYFDTVRDSFMDYALDPFGNYIVQYMVAEGDQVANSTTLANYCQGQIHNMVCHKYASNIIEKCFGLVTPELQHSIIEEMFTGADATLSRMLSDSSANYVVQAAIRAASYRDVAAINQRISPLLLTIPYGKKIQQRLNRRLNH